MFRWIYWAPRRLVSKVVKKAQAPRPMMDDETLGTVLTALHDCWWSLSNSLGDVTSVIPPVKVTTKFSGYGYVKGRISAIKVNARVAVCSADDDMDYTEYCVLMDGAPILLVLRRGSSVLVTIIAERSFLADVFNTAAMSMNTVEEFRKMPEPVQRVMNDVLKRFYELRLKRLEEKAANNPIEKMLTYL